jgi:hypothetical protein
MKLKPGELHAMLVKEGVVTVVEPVKRPQPLEANVVARPTPTNAAPRLTDPPKPKVADPPSGRHVPELHGLQLAIAANTAKGAQPVCTTLPEPVTGLSRAINANIELQKIKTTK